MKVYVLCKFNDTGIAFIHSIHEDISTASKLLHTMDNKNYDYRIVDHDFVKSNKQPAGQISYDKYMCNLNSRRPVEYTSFSELPLSVRNAWAYVESNKTID